MGWIAIIEFGLGVFLRLFNEHNKQKAVDHKMTLALVSQQTEIINKAREDVTKSTFLQELMMLMVVVALLIAGAFPILAVWLDVPLVVLWEHTVTNGFWIFQSSKEVRELVPVEGLYLVPEILAVIASATRFLFGAVIGGIGRR